MKVEEILQKTVSLINNYTDSFDPKDFENLLTLYNMVEQNLALDYFPLHTSEEMEGEYLSYEEFMNSPISILGITDLEGNEKKFLILPTKLKTGLGRSIVKYSYFPKHKNLSDECEYNTEKMYEIISIGVASEYFLCKGYYETASFLDRKYKDSIFKLKEILTNESKN